MYRESCSTVLYIYIYIYSRDIDIDIDIVPGPQGLATTAAFLLAITSISIESI